MIIGKTDRLLTEKRKLWCYPAWAGQASDQII